MTLRRVDTFPNLLALNPKCCCPFFPHLLILDFRFGSIFWPCFSNCCVIPTNDKGSQSPTNLVHLWGLTRALLHEKFSTFGKFISLAISKDYNGLLKGFAFVNYKNPNDARKAMEAMNGSLFSILRASCLNTKFLFSWYWFCTYCCLLIFHN